MELFDDDSNLLSVIECLAGKSPIIEDLKPLLIEIATPIINLKLANPSVATAKLNILKLLIQLLEIPASESVTFNPVKTHGTWFFVHSSCAFIDDGNSVELRFFHGESISEMRDFLIDYCENSDFSLLKDSPSTIRQKKLSEVYIDAIRTRPTHWIPEFVERSDGTFIPVTVRQNTTAF